MSLYSSEGEDSASSDSKIIDVYIVDYEYGPAGEEFFQLDNIVQCLFNARLLNDIECRKIMMEMYSPKVVKIRSTIYEILLAKDAKTLKEILQVFRNRVHPFQNPRILRRIFSYLHYNDFSKCKQVCRDWKQIIDLLLVSQYDEVNLQQCLLMNLLSKNEEIQSTKSVLRKDEEGAFAFQLMLASNPENDETLLKTLEIRKDIPLDVNDISINGSFAAENNTGRLIAKALSNLTVLSNIFKFLTLEDIKNCRTVCRTWNSVSEPQLRKLSAIKFYTNFNPKDFINVFKYLPLPNLQFKAFKFREFFSAEELSEFFLKFGENIRSLDLYLQNGVRSCLSHACNLTELSFVGAKVNKFNGHPEIDLQNNIPWNILQSIKILYLRDTVIEIDKDQDWKRITPVKLHLTNVHFFVGGHYPVEVTLNDYIDFTKITDANMGAPMRQFQLLDWAKDTFETEKLRVSNNNIRFVCTGKSKSTVKYLNLRGQYALSEEGRGMSVKELFIERNSNSFNDLPLSIEKLAVSRQDSYSRTMESNVTNYLPKLKYLSLSNAFRRVSVFKNCPNLTAIEIMGFSCIPMDIGWLPKSIKKLKMQSSYAILHIFGGLTDEHLDLDLLILHDILTLSLSGLKFDKLRPKVLVLEITAMYNENADKDFISLLQRNKKMDKIYVKFTPAIEPKMFSESQLSKRVDKESKYYEFRNECGKAITFTEFDAISNSLAANLVMKGFWATKKECLANQSREELYMRFQSICRRTRL